MFCQKNTISYNCEMKTIVTTNVRGLRENSKRKEVFLYHKKLKHDIIFMQETHSSSSDEHVW